MTHFTTFYKCHPAQGWLSGWDLRRLDCAIAIGNGIDLARFDPGRQNTLELERLRAELGVADRVRVVTMVCRATPEKGPLISSRWLESFRAAAAT